VIQVDGKPLRERRDRITAPFAEAADDETALALARNVAADSARYELRDAGTANHPLLVFGFLHRSAQPQFEFTLDRVDRSVAADAWIVRYRETARPTILRGPNNTDVPATGRVWIQAGSGRVLRTELEVTVLGGVSRVVTNFAGDDRLRAHLPAEMRHTFGDTAVPNRVAGTARYRGVRRVETREDLEAARARAAAAAPADSSATALVARAGAYVENFVQKFSRVVAEERYTQEYYELRMEGSRGTFLGTPQLRERRRLQSDLLLVQTQGAAQWFVLRDVFTADDTPVRDRDERLMKLFLESPDDATALERARAISLESARHSLRYTGTIDHPLFAIGFLQRNYRDRFRFTGGEPDRSAGPNVRVVEFRETVRPTIVKAVDGSDIVSLGKLWIDAGTGRVVRTELDASSTRVQSRVITQFADDKALGIHVPTEMQYRFRTGTLGSEVRGMATYGRFRQFSVRTEEKVERR
jgi:hypothetical protein